MEDGGKGRRPDLIVDGGGDMTLLIQYSCNIFSTQDNAVASITHDESAAAFSWNSKILEDYWY